MTFFLLKVFHGKNPPGQYGQSETYFSYVKLHVKCRAYLYKWPSTSLWIGQGVEHI